MKICRNCKETKPINLFSKRRRYCKQCDSERNRKDYQRDKEKRLKKQYEKYWNDDVFKKKLIESNKKSYKEYKEKNLKRNKENYNKNKKYYLEYFKRKDVKEKYGKKRRERYKNDLEYKMKNVLVSHFSLFFKRKGKNKYLRSNEIIDYTYKELIIHLENNFREGMSWDNYGELWEIHHIKPQNLFDVSNPKEVRECWELDNLTPLWKTTEISHQMGDTVKGNRNVGKTEIYFPYIDSQVNSDTIRILTLLTNKNKRL